MKKITITFTGDQGYSEDFECEADSIIDCIHKIYIDKNKGFTK